MASLTLVPYIFFQGNCREAMEFYKGVFGGELTTQTWGEVPGDFPGKSEHPEWVMHSSLEGDIKLFGSDSQKASAKAAKVDLSLGGDDEAKLHAFFDGLSIGGEVSQPLEKQFWGDTFGMLTDKYGVEWMVNIAGPKG